jgi:hypothetical protein
MNFLFSDSCVISKDKPGFNSNLIIELNLESFFFNSLSKPPTSIIFLNSSAFIPDSLDNSACIQGVFIAESI